MITALYAGILAILYLLLTAYVIRGRWIHKIGLGNGKNPDMARRVRVHGNFAEYTPFCLLLLFLVDYTGSAPVTVHVLGGMLVVGRAAHAFGLAGSANFSPGRAVGMLLTLGMMGASAGLLLWKFFALWTVSF